MIGCTIYLKEQKYTRDDNKFDSYLGGERLVTLRMILVNIKLTKFL